MIPRVEPCIQEPVKRRRRKAFMHVRGHGRNTYATSGQETQAGNRAKFSTRLEIDKGLALINR